MFAIFLAKVKNIKLLKGVRNTSVIQYKYSYSIYISYGIKSDYVDSICIYSNSECDYNLFSMAMGLVPYTTGVTLPWTTPPIIGGFLATGSWQGAVLQVILVLISFMIYFPF